MRSKDRRLEFVAAVLVGICAFGLKSANGVDVVLADWENRGPTGNGGAGTDFDPTPIDGTPSCTGCWLKGNTGVLSTLSQGTVGVTRGTRSLKLDVVGRGLGGGEGAQDTHFDLGARVFWSVAQNDPRALALRNAINGNQGLFTVEFDVTYDIPALRALSWLGPPVDFPAKPAQFIGLGLYKNANNDGGGFTHVALEQSLPTLINPFSPAFDGITHLTRHVSISLEDFGFPANPTTPPTSYEVGFSVNGNWGTNPAASNTQAATYYIDNMVLREFNPIAPIDFNNNAIADLGDWQLFIAQYGRSTPALGDLVGLFGASGQNGVVDFHDLQEFERLYDLANGGLGALSSAINSVPEPSSSCLTVLLVGMGLSLRYRSWN